MGPSRSSRRRSCFHSRDFRSEKSPAGSLQYWWAAVEPQLPMERRPNLDRVFLEGVGPEKRVLLERGVDSAVRSPASTRRRRHHARYGHRQ